MILPCEDYEKNKLERMKKDFENMADAMFPAMFKKMFPAMMDAIREQMLEEEGEINAIIGLKIQNVLKDKGYEIKKKRLIGKKNEKVKEE